MGRTRDIATILAKTDAANADNHALLNTSSGVDSADVNTLVSASDYNRSNRNLIMNGDMQIAQRFPSHELHIPLRC